MSNQKPGEVLTHAPQMSLRDWFAGQALASAGVVLQSGDDGMLFIPHKKIAAERAYEMADAMMEARNK